MSLNVDNCNQCGKIYVKNNYGLCPTCIKGLEKQYEACLIYLRQNHNCNIQELSDATKVPIKQIVTFIREGRISVRNNPNLTYECEVCGTAIREHIMCEPCRSRLSKEASNMREDEKRRAELAKDQRTTFKIQDRLQDRLK